MSFVIIIFMAGAERDSGARPHKLVETGRYPYPETILFTPDFSIITGNGNKDLARKVGRILETEIQETADTFADGETRIRIPNNIRRRDVFVVQSTCPPVNDNLAELKFMLDATRRSSASEITAVIPYFGYARQDRKDRSRVPISAAVVAREIEAAGADRIVTLDLHSETEQGFVNIPWDNLHASIAMIPVLKDHFSTDNLVVASPDKGGMTRATAYAKRLQSQGVAMVYKRRDVDVANTSEALGMIGDVEGREVLVVDDMIDTAGTVVNATDMLLERGAKSVAVAATHGLFSNPAIERINKSNINKVFVADSVNLNSEAKACPKIQVISVASLLAEAIKRIYVGESLSDLIQ